MRSKDCVDQGRLSETSLALSHKGKQQLAHCFVTRKFRAMIVALTDTHNIELETTLQELLLDLRGDAVETDMAAREDGARGSCDSGCRGHG